MRVLFATAEIAPLVRVGGLSEAASGLVASLRRRAEIELEVVLPDYGTIDIDEHESFELEAPPWASPVRARVGHHAEFGPVTLIDRVGLARPHPYVDPNTGEPWGDNDHRFFSFSAGVAALARRRAPDLLHLNDWHTAATVGFLAEPPPTVLTIHTLGYQGVANGGWMSQFPVDPWRFAWYDVVNPLAAAIRTVDRIIAVSPTYAREILGPDQGMGLDHELGLRRASLVGIRNGINVAEWNPAIDTHLPRTYDIESVREGKQAAKAALLAEVGLDAGTRQPLLGLVSRLVDQKGIDLVRTLGPYLERLGVKLVILGSGTPALTQAVRDLEADHPDHVAAVVDRYDVGLAHHIFAGADALLMPSRFEPCGLAQMQAMAYGTVPVASAVGGLVDTIVDVDDDPVGGTGVLLSTVDGMGLIDGVHRVLRALGHARRKQSIQRRGMSADWSWERPADAHLEVYRAAVADRADQSKR